MKKLSLVAAVVLASLAGSAYADTQSVIVNARVLGICKFTTATQTVNFNDIDPSSNSEQTQGLSVSYKCTKDATPVTIAVSAAAGDTVPLTNGTNTMAFTVDAFPAGATGQGFSVASSTTSSTIRIAVAQFQDKPAGSYTGSLKINITP